MAEAKGNANADTAGASAGTQNSETVLSDKARAATQNASNESDQDVNVDEALALAALSDTRAWNANVKRTYDRVEEEIGSAVKSTQSHLDALRGIQIQQLANMSVNCDNLQKQHLAHRDIATDRTWNVDEVSALTAKSGAQADAMVVALLEALARVQNKT